MHTLWPDGLKISVQDKKVFEHDSLITPKEYSQKGLEGFISKAISNIMRDWFDKYKAQATGDISTDIPTVITEIAATEGFTQYNQGSPGIKVPQRTTAPTEQIWAAGFEVEDHEWLALNMFYADPAKALVDAMHNKLHGRKEAFVKQGEDICLNDPEITSMPKTHDDMVDLICARPGYKNAVQSVDL